MARPVRIEYPGAVYHVMNRGNARQAIFRKKEHYELFLKCLAEVIHLWNVRIHAFSLMPNHYHLLLETPLGNLSRVMRHLNHVYTQRFNRLVTRDGHLFRGRYKSILVEEDAYLVELLRYIHLNPVKANLVEQPEKHMWTSHRSYLTGSGADIVTTSRLLSFFGKRKNQARKKLHAFVLAGVPDELEKRLSSRRWPSVLSSDNFKDWVEWNFVKDLEDKEVQYVSESIKPVTESNLRKALCHILECSWEELRSPQNRQGQQRRAQALALYRYYLKYGYKKLSKTFGVTPSRISKIMQQAPLATSELCEKMDILLAR
ncbi:MAG: transposase [Deltaproteobacteria bacterium]|nr:transposase [Deltaproteobacteria bacterium]